MKKIFWLIFFLLTVVTSSYAFSSDKKVSGLTAVPLFTTESKAENIVWAGTFQLVWNDLANDIIKDNIYLQGGNDDIVNGLNKQSFKSNMISSKSYYKTHGVMTNALRDDINQALKDKFNETSGILQNAVWDGKNYLLYAMLKKDFNYPYDFNELQPDKFGKSKKNVRYFGIDRQSNITLRSMIDVMFYNSKNDYGIILNTKGRDLILLYRTNNILSFADAYKEMLEKSFTYEGSRKFGKNDTFKIPFIKFKNEYTYTNLINKKILGTDFTIGSAMQTIDFNMDNKGIKLKSEASIAMRMSLDPQDFDSPRDFDFDDNFYLFMQEGMTHPYFAMKIGNTAALNQIKN